MSTYLKTAAMSLLSKTLQTFLTKYLSDVDVEAVTLPSYDGSGWGVRLKNVKLREGVQLMEVMPGKIVKKRKIRRRRRVRRRKQKMSSQERIIENKEPISTIRENDTTQTKRFSVGEESYDDKTKTTSTEAELDALPEYYSDEDIKYDSSGYPLPTRRPSTPVQTSRMFSCFSNRNGTNNGSSTEGKNKYDDSFHQQQQQQQQRHMGDQNENITGEYENQDSFTNDKGSSSSLPTEGENNNIPTINDNDDDDDDANYVYEYFEEEEDYEEDYEYPVRLCLGEDGRIGTIDVRLIGKELHVMVEDAEVTIEAIPIKPKNDTDEDDQSCDDNTIKHSTSAESESDDNTQNASNGDDNFTDASSNSNQKNGATEPKPEPKRDTVGDRVLADNALARIISAIPHLFLRDIRIRLIVRDEPMTPSTESEANNTSSMGGYRKPQSSSKDTMVEVGIDFLSVDSGGDIFSHFQNQTTEDDYHNNNNFDGNSSSVSIAETSIKPPSLLRIPSNNIGDANVVEHKNEYLIRHIRTGRGPSAGIFVELFVPNSQFSKIATRNASSSEVVWARQKWVASTENHLLRCSGLDIQARIYMGTKTVEMATSYSWFFGEDFEEGDESDYDSIILFGGGMDTIAPGPLPLAPMEPRISRGTTPNKSDLESFDKEIVAAMETNIENVQSTSIHPGVDVYHVDANGVQSCNVPSLFHRVSRGMELSSCKDCKHLPSEVCDLCWEAPNSEINLESPLDYSIPMPGLTLQFSIRDPLEINIDRNNLETIGLLKSIFTKSTPPPKDFDPEKDSAKKKVAAANVVVPSNTEDTTQATSSSTGFFSGLLYGKKEEAVQEEELLDSYESYMQPENITVLGVYFAETTIRVHVMREDRDDRDLSFCYWQIETKCLTIDCQSLNTSEKIFQDLELDIGQFAWNEFCGTNNEKNVASFGLLQLHSNRQRCDSHTSVSSMIEDHAQNSKPWPSTACALLDIPPPLESLDYKNREGHGLQFRFINLPSVAGVDPKSKSLINLRLGVTAVDSPWTVRKDITLIVSEIMNNIVRTKDGSGTESKSADDLQKSDETKSEEVDEENANPLPKSLMTYTIQIDSGNISLYPLVEVKMPMTHFYGERSSLAGFSIEALLEKMEFSHGTKEPRTKKGGCLSLPQIARLPESARMHILFCLEDISSLEKAFDVKKEKNSFRRIKAVDKAILRTAKKIVKRNSKNIISKRRSSNYASLPRDSIFESSNRRQRILTEIMKLDDSDLTNLWSVHQRYQKKLAKKTQGSFK